ncbi:MAG: Mur ligase family protein [Patescibacteria group bacterium]|jgi:UDP-N-acetylmuramoylalanine--D-glutamate ligase
MTSQDKLRIKNYELKIKESPRAKVFRYLDYKLDEAKLKIAFNYRIEFANRPAMDFTDEIVLPKKTKELSAADLASFLEPLHLIMGISYYKLYCPPKIEHGYQLTKEQAEFWNVVYRKGLGEFLYRNKLDPNKVASFPFCHPDRNVVEWRDPLQNTFTVKQGIPRLRAFSLGTSLGMTEGRDKILLGIGGGKDSIVAAELMKDFDVTSFLVETQREDEITRNVISKLGRPSLIVRRNLDPKIFEHHEGSYNGHIPISAVFAFTGLLTARLYGFDYVAVGNEQSSNFGNIVYRGETINHQWSKSAEFESMLQEYTSRFITTDIKYFSALRQFYEIRVAKMFAEHKKYFSTFTSCNRNFKVHKERPGTLWCGECPKCAFVFLMLAAFVPKNELIGIFKKNLLADKVLTSLYRDLLGFGSLKPFDCVGTFEESRAALYLASKKFKNDVNVKTFLSKIKNPQSIVKKVMSTVQAPTLPTSFRLLGVENVCILGYGNEGRVNERFVKKFYPHLKVSILDQSRDKNYLAKQTDFDLALKTPGIAKTKVTIPYTTATNLFFSRNKNLTIGVTGSKGKSTTVSLIYEMLKAGGKKVRLLGNIGNPMLETVFEKVDSKEIFVIELSSYMLDDIEYSPNIAVLLNLFPEHMTYHGGVENYYAAKKNIFKFQKPGDIAVTKYNDVKLPVKASEVTLLGQHNLKNLKAAVKVARLLKVSDKDIARAIKNFKPLPHRLEFVGRYDGIDFYDDAISTTPESTIMAIKSLKKVDTIFLGGEDRGYDFVELEKVLRKSGIRNIVLFPDTGKRILKSKKGFNILSTTSMEKAIQFAYKYTVKDRICLLSTASPSYSLWKNFEYKGDEFQKYVRLNKKQS